MHTTVQATKSALRKLPYCRLLREEQVLPADTLTPVALYLRLRDRYPGAVLLECNDVHAGANRFSYIGLSPLASLRVDSGLLEVETPTGRYAEAAGWERPLSAQVKDFMACMELEANGAGDQTPNAVDGQEGALEHSAFFGHTGFDAIQYFDTVSLDPDKRKRPEVPDLHYRFYRYVLVFDHFRDRLHMLEHRLEGEASTLGALQVDLERSVHPQYPFSSIGQERSTTDPETYLGMVEQAKHHCRRGDVFQMVLSRRFRQAYRGDEFAVYRQLRSINPSPYLFFFDFGDYRLFGSSPEAQLVVRNQEAEMHPIAGTYRRSGNDAEDAASAEQLAKDPKENAEHVMLVDLARNDLGRHGRNVEVAAFRELQYFSHVIHMVSRVRADLPADAHALDLFSDTFPAGTLSGAPKYRALELIDQLEGHSRGFYGGAVGVLGLDGSLNHAISIRSFLARDGHLEYQAGAGIVVDSVPEKELAEIDHKLAALRRAIAQAGTETSISTS